MRVGIIGAGFTGLAAAKKLTEEHHQVTIFEKEAHPGGLAIGFTEEKWQWTLEQHYHHWFTNDHAILQLAREIGNDIIIRRPKTSVYLQGRSYQLDSPLHVLTFPLLTPVERFRMAAVLGVLKYNPFWQPLEQFNTATILPKLMGEKAYHLLWEPQLVNKFGQAASSISLAWFWARITKRTSSLAYPKKGFLHFAEEVAQFLQKQGTTIHYNCALTSLETTPEGKVMIHSLQNGKKMSETFDQVIVTLSAAAFLKLAPQLPENYRKKLSTLKSIGAINLVLRLSKPFFADKTYWMSICEKNAPIMAIVEHTHFMDKKQYHNEHVVYLGNYLPVDHPSFQLNAEELLTKYDPFLKTINPQYKKNLIKAHVFKAPFAQPIIPPHYSRLMPPLTTPLPHVYLANMQQVYPWDRGTNYAVELGEKVAALIQNAK